MSKYKCIKPFSIPEVDVYCNETGNNIEINIGKIYELDESCVPYVGAEIHLDSTEDLTWVEISSETFKECFEEVKGDAE